MANTPARITEQRELAVPFRIGHNGSVVFTSSEVEIAASRLRTIIGTAIGERVMRPKYGTKVQSLVFEPDGAVVDLITYEITDAVRAHEPDITLHNVTVEQPLERNEVQVTVFFSKAPLPDVYQTTATIDTLFSEA